MTINYRVLTRTWREEGRHVRSRVAGFVTDDVEVLDRGEDDTPVATFKVADGRQVFLHFASPGIAYEDDGTTVTFWDRDVLEAIRSDPPPPRPWVGAMSAFERATALNDKVQSRLDAIATAMGLAGAEAMKDLPLHKARFADAFSREIERLAGHDRGPLVDILVEAIEDAEARARTAN